MAKNLMIVESPAKAKTIEKFLGSDFQVKSCYGHIRDLPKDDKAINVDKNYEPKYVISPDKKELVDELTKLAKKAEQIWLATDEDREGEAISWHLCEVLGIDPKTAKRIVFHEITKPAIVKAVQNPRSLNLNLVNAQQARRVLDRLVGFELSPILWKKISLKNSLSAGRVQSVAVRLIVEREREINSFNAQSSFRVTGTFHTQKDAGKHGTVKAELNKKFDHADAAKDFLENLIAKEYKVADVVVKPSKRSPSAPFITSTLQQEASRKLGFSVQKTMMIAQSLYEAGHITYMRTDSVNLSETALQAAGEQIESLFGKKYCQQRQFSTKAAGAQEAHEAIRPTYFQNQTIEGSADDKRLYELIWKRTLASQMADAQLEVTTVTLDIISGKDKQSAVLNPIKEKFIAKGEVIVFDGFLKLYIESLDEEPDEDETALLPPLKTGQMLDAENILATERFTRPAPRYTEASLVRKLEELGIGRPSTYAPTISTIQKRGYVVRKSKDGTQRPFQVFKLEKDKLTAETKSETVGAEKNKLFPSDIGMVVNDFLMEHFEKVMDYSFTANIEKDFDEIALEGKEWTKMVDLFYRPFHETVEKTMEGAGKATGERILGVDPESGRQLSVKVGRYGPIAQIGTVEEEEKPRFASLRPEQNIATITYEEALALFALPRTLGDLEGKTVVASIGRFGPFIRHDNKFVSIPKHLSPYEISLPEAIELIEKKRIDDANKFIAAFDQSGIEILNGRFGPYIKRGKENFKIPKGTKATDLTEADCLVIIEKAASAPAKKKPPRKKS